MKNVPPLPVTSKMAYEKAKPMIEDHHDKILKALGKHGTANYEMIADECGLDKHQVGRRLSELERKQIIYKPGGTKPTKSGRQAFTYAIVDNDPFMYDLTSGKFDDMANPPATNNYSQKSLFP